jgi:hypothetical protein
MAVSNRIKFPAVRTIGSFALSLFLCAGAFGATQPNLQRLHAQTEFARQQLAQTERDLAAAQAAYNQALFNANNGGGYGGGYPGYGYSGAGYGDSAQADRAQVELNRISDALPGLQNDAKQAAKDVDNAKKDVDKQKTAVVEAQKAVDVTLSGREKAFHDGPPYQDALAAVRQAEAAQSAAEIRIVQSLAASDPEFARLQAKVAALEASVKTLRKASPPADPKAIADASKQWMDAKGQLVRRLDAAKDADPEAIAARDALKTAQSGLAKLKRDFDDSLKADPAVVDAKKLLQQSRPAYEAATKELARAKRDKRAADAAVDGAIGAAQQAAADLAQAYGGSVAGTGLGWQVAGGGIYGGGFNYLLNQLSQAQANRDLAAGVLRDAAAREQAAIAAAGGTGTGNGTAVASNAPGAESTTATPGAGSSNVNVKRATNTAVGARPGRVAIPPNARAPRFVGGKIVRSTDAADSATSTAGAAQVSASDAVAATAQGTAAAASPVTANASQPATAVSGDAAAAAAQARGRAFSRERYAERRAEWVARDQARRAAQNQQAAATASANTPGVVDRRQNADQPQQTQSQSQSLQQRQRSTQLQQQQLQQQLQQRQQQQQQQQQQHQQSTNTRRATR